MTLQTIAQLIMLATLILMITGRTPIYMTAITGAAISAIVAGFPLAGGQGMTVTKMIVSGLNPVIADMTGILLFIGIMQATGFLDVIFATSSVSATRLAVALVSALPAASLLVLSALSPASRSP